jgi:serine/threonine protein kinase
MKKASSDTAFAAGTVLGKYEILRPLARGGMAELYLARPRSLPGFEKLLALKRVLPELARKKDVVQMFLDEARLAATLEHPNVIQTYDVGVVDGNYFMAMEFLHGQSLAAVLHQLDQRGERAPLDVALEIAIRVCAGLHYAHERRSSDGRSLGIVHRDVSPQNVFVTYEGGVKLIDFGVAKAATQMNKTNHGTIKGKLSYLSPEQIRCEPLDRRSDLFSLGIVMYEMTLGRRPFPGGSDFAVIKQITEETVKPPSVLDREYPPSLERVVMRMLERDRDQRQQSAREIGHELEDVARGLSLFLSSSRLSKFMEGLFANQVAAHKAAQRREATEIERIESISSMQMVLMPDERWAPAEQHTMAVGSSMIELEAVVDPARAGSVRKKKRRRAEEGEEEEREEAAEGFPWSVALGGLAAAVIVVLVVWIAR